MHRQQVLYLWLAEGALDTGTIAWAFHDGTKGKGPGLPDCEPPFANGVAALEDGWFLLQFNPVSARLDRMQFISDICVFLCGHFCSCSLTSI